VLAGAVAFALIGVIGGGGGALASGCVPDGARTVAAAGGARLYIEGGALFGCLGATRTRLGGAPGSPHLGATRVVRFALAPRYAGIDTLTMGVDTLESTVSIVDLTTGATSASAPATTPERRAESFINATALAIDRQGTLAWIGSRSAIGVPAPTYEVHTLTRRGTGSLLASSARIAPHSLRLRATTLSWRQGGRTHTRSIAP
jgi:hypothetical protein